jgi:hypothetical protein
MKRLGYTRFVAQGGDWGAVIVDLMGVQAPPELLGIHVNMPGILPPEIAQRFAPVNVAPAPAGLSADEQRCYEDLSDVYTKGIGYAIQMLLRPQTLYGIADSPVGLAAWMVDHDARSYEDITHAFVDGRPVGNLTRDEVLDNITLTWFTNTGISSARLYHENAYGFFDAKGVSSVPGRSERLPQGALPGTTELDRAGLPQPHLLQRGRPRRPLRGLAGTGTLLRGGSCGVPVPSVDDHVRGSADALA